MKNLITSDGNSVKSIDFGPWGGIEGFLSATSGTMAMTRSAMLRVLVSWYQRGITMTANEISSLPFEVINSAGEVIDSSAQWKNALGGMKSPRMTINKLASSLAATGRAYMIPTYTTRAMELTYVTPDSVSPFYDSANGKLLAFTRTPSGRYLPDQILYFFYPDDTVEQDYPPNIYPGRVSLLSANIIAAMDSALQSYGESGFVPPTLLMVKGIPNQAEREKTEKWWNSFLRRATKTIAKVINAETISIQQIGAGANELRGTYIQIKRQLIEDVGQGFGIPASLFLSNSANRATALADKASWYKSGEFVSIYQTIESVLTDQAYSRFGCTFRFNLQGVEAMQVDEVDRAGAVSGLSASMAQYPNTTTELMEFFGYDITEQQSTDMIIAAEKDSAQASPAFPEVSQEVAGELKSWENFAIKHAGTKTRQFETKHVPASLALQIRHELENAKTAQEISRVFSRCGAELPVIALARAIEKLAGEIE